MNILVTNTQKDQAYLIVRSLRHVADKIVVAMQGASAFQRWKGPAPWSRLVNRRYGITEPSDSWWSGVLQQHNTEQEEAYIRRIEGICRAEKIDAVFPSYEPDLYVLSKNRERLEALGAIVVCPSYERLQVPMNKLRTLRLAGEAGFPHPRSFVPVGPEGLDEVLEQLGPPFVIKPRFSANARFIRIATTIDELKRFYAWVHERQPTPIVQEFIPGYRRQNYYLLVARDMTIISLFAPKNIRTRQRGVAQSNIAGMSSSVVPFAAELTELISRIGMWGCMTVQTVIDSRDNTPKLMEINPRLGDRLWHRLALGHNEPEMLLRVALNKPLPPIAPIPEGHHIADPIEDTRNLIDHGVDGAANALRRLLGRGPATPSYREAQTVRELLASMRESYFGPAPLAMSPYWRNFWSDPAPCAVRNLKVLLDLERRRQVFSG